MSCGNGMARRRASSYHPHHSWQEVPHHRGHQDAPPYQAELGVVLTGVRKLEEPVPWNNLVLLEELSALTRWRSRESRRRPSRSRRRRSGTSSQHRVLSSAGRAPLHQATSTQHQTKENVTLDKVMSPRSTVMARIAATTRLMPPGSTSPGEKRRRSSTRVRSKLNTVSRMLSQSAGFTVLKKSENELRGYLGSVRSGKRSHHSSRNRCESGVLISGRNRVQNSRAKNAVRHHEGGIKPSQTSANIQQFCTMRRHVPRTIKRILDVEQQNDEPASLLRRRGLGAHKSVESIPDLSGFAEHGQLRREDTRRRGTKGDEYNCIELVTLTIPNLLAIAVSGESLRTSANPKHTLLHQEQNQILKPLHLVVRIIGRRAAPRLLGMVRLKALRPSRYQSSMCRIH
mmetsp:Transcript_19436/g.29404  ORF Transcript_19436/g.29404 Transcript_19436/m.29404 type:complete len:400 (-) Transcript_19436:198-1397(-)